MTTTARPRARGVRRRGERASDSKRDLIRSLERIEADIAEIKSEVERMRDALAEGAAVETDRRLEG